jgi:hypothetical protein
VEEKVLFGEATCRAKQDSLTCLARQGKEEEKKMVL